MGKEKQYRLPDHIPDVVSEPDILYAVRQQNVNSTYIGLLKDLSGLKDDLLSSTLNMNTKTFRSYKLNEAPIKPYIQEHVLALLSLFKHGISVFGTNDKFNFWLKKTNYYFDNDAPINFLNTISGILHVDHRLTAIEYGDNI